MRKLKLQVQLSLDGFMSGPNGELDWMIWNWDEELNNFVHKLTDPVDHVLLGRNLAEGFIPHWQKAADDASADEYTKRMAVVRKTVFSKDLDPGSPEVRSWKNTIIENGDLATGVINLKNSAGGDLIAYGGASFVTSLIEKRLIDEYHLFYNPVAIRTGKSIFHHLSSNLKLKLTNSRAFDCGIVINSYKNEN